MAANIIERLEAVTGTGITIGGMPDAVVNYLENQNLMEVAEVQQRILNEYIADMAKYATSASAVKIRSCYNSIPAQLAKESRKFQYKVVQKGGTVTIFGESIEWLSSAGAVLNCQLISHGEIPVAVYVDLPDFKLYMSDTGLLTMKSQMPHSMIISETLINNLFMVAITENYVAQSLKANGHTLYCWKSGNRAEVDFVIQLDEAVVPIEVKPSVNVRSKSLSVFSSRYGIARSIRASLRNFGFENGI